MDIKKIENFIGKQRLCFIDDENYPNIKAMLKPRISKNFIFPLILHL